MPGATPSPAKICPFFGPVLEKTAPSLLFLYDLSIDHLIVAGQHALLEYVLKVLDLIDADRLRHLRPIGQRSAGSHPQVGQGFRSFQKFLRDRAGTRGQSGHRAH